MRDKNGQFAIAKLAVPKHLPQLRQLPLITCGDSPFFIKLQDTKDDFHI